ncbi:hypothetical protein SAMN05216436_106125 [bacterium A37T11]|nr:hypothetical protein SAMN05216436_106125 [bacterium A37T11]
MELTVEEIPNGFHVVLSYSEQKTSTDVINVSETLSLNQKRIIDAMKANKKVTYAELAKLIVIAPTNGPAKGGHWEVNR